MRIAYDGWVVRCRFGQGDNCTRDPEGRVFGPQGAIPCCRSCAKREQAAFYPFGQNTPE